MYDQTAKTVASRPSEGDSNLSSHRRAWQDTQLDEETKDWLARDEKAFLRQSLSTPCLNVLKGAAGVICSDLQGREFLDFHGNSVHQLGYGHPRVVEAVEKQLRTLPFCPRRYTNIPAIELAEKLGAIAPGALNKVLFAPGGTSAVGMAVKLARMATGRFKTISMWESFHGASLDAISLGGESLFRQNIGPLLPGAEHVPLADPYRCLWNPGGECGSCDLRCALYIEYVLEQEGDVAAVVAEPIRCTSVNPPPPGYWQRVRRACDRHGTLLIFGADLVQDYESKTPAEEAADSILYSCLAQGLSFKVSHGSFLTLTPPLTTTHSELDRALDILEHAFAGHIG